MSRSFRTAKWHLYAKQLASSSSKTTRRHLRGITPIRVRRSLLAPAAEGLIQALRGNGELQGDEQQNNGWHHLRLALGRPGSHTAQLSPAHPTQVPQHRGRPHLPPQEAGPPGETWGPSGVSSGVSGSGEGRAGDEVKVSPLASRGAPGPKSRSLCEGSGRKSPSHQQSLPRPLATPGSRDHPTIFFKLSSPGRRTGLPLPVELRCAPPLASSPGASRHQGRAQVTLEFVVRLSLVSPVSH